MPAVYFLDTSAALARYLRRAPGHSWVSAICAPQQRNAVCIALITEVEMSSAINQLARGKVLRQKQRNEALTLFWSQIEEDQYRVIPVSEAIVMRAAMLCNAHPLRGYDAVQLACALAVRDAMRAVAAGSHISVQEPRFVSEDKRLLNAAAAEGFAVENPLDHP